MGDGARAGAPSKTERQGGEAPAIAGRHREPWPLLRSYVAPEDAARAFRLALECAGAPFGVFIITAADTFDPEPTLVHLEKTYGTRIEVRKPEIYAKWPRASAWDITRAREVLGWSPSQDWDGFSRRSKSPRRRGLNYAAAGARRLARALARALARQAERDEDAEHVARRRR